MSNGVLQSTNRTSGSRGLRHRTKSIEVAFIAVCSLAACDSLLEVELPGRLPAAALTDPTMASVLVSSVQADFECAFASYAAFTGLYADEWITASPLFPITSIDTRATNVEEMGNIGCPDNSTDSNPGYYLHLQVARAGGQTAFDIISGHPDAAVADKNRKLATISAYTGAALTMLGEGFCEMAIDQGGAMQPAEVLRLAEEKFSTAISLAQSTGAEDIVNWASAMRARVRVQLGDNAGALSDAERVPAGFVKYATYDATPGRRQNRVYTQNLLGRFASLHPSFRNLQVNGVPDTRLQAYDTGQQGHDGGTQVWAIRGRFASAAEPIPIASWEEAQLIIAEVKGGQEAVAAINRLRDAAGLPRFVSADPTEIRATLLEERRRILFGQGQRIADLLRFPELEFEQGTNHKNQPYYAGNTCLPLPLAEKNTNPNL